MFPKKALGKPVNPSHIIIFKNEPNPHFYIQQYSVMLIPNQNEAITI